MVQLCRGATKAQPGSDAVDGGPRPNRPGDGGRVCVHGQRLLDQPSVNAGAGFFLQGWSVMEILDAIYDFSLIWSKVFFSVLWFGFF